VPLYCAGPHVLRDEDPAAGLDHAAGRHVTRIGADHDALERFAAYAITSNSPAAPMPPPMHMVTTTCFTPRRRPSISAWPTRREPETP